MHNLKELRNNLNILKKKFKDRNVDFDVSNFKNKDRAYIQRLTVKKSLNLLFRLIKQGN